MGREIRRVPPDWQHPRGDKGRDYRPLYDRSFTEDARAWLDHAIAWDNGTHEDAAEEKGEHPFWWQWDGDPPDPAYYRPDWPEDSATAFQVYETVSEGTPVTPVFASKAELVAYLVANGDFWDQERGDGGWAREAAERFVEREWAPSLVGMAGRLMAPRDQSDLGSEGA
jgi:hypothetical protein